MPAVLTERQAALVLAAGTGSRMGGMVKPLIRMEGQPIVCRLVGSLQAAGIERIVVVIGPHTQGVQQALHQAFDSGLVRPSSGLSFAQAAPGSGQMHSLLQGLTALADTRADVMVCLADQPLIGLHAVASLLSAFAHRPPLADMVLPCVDGRPGNPVVLSAALVQEWLLLPEAQIGKAWRDAHPQRVHLWPAPDAQYVTDLDTPDDLQALRDRGLRVAEP